VPKTVKDGDKMWNAFSSYARELDEMVRDEMPKLLDQMKDVAAQGETAADRAGDEIDNLGAMQKAKAGINVPKNLWLLKSSAENMPKQAENLKEELENLKQAAEEVKQQLDGDKFKDGCKQLKEKPQADARLSFREVFDMPPFSEEEWTSWSAAMDKKKVKYDVKDYGK